MHRRCRVPRSADRPGDTVPDVAEQMVQTPVGDARLIIDRARTERGTLVLGHGASGRRRCP